jgi:FKBP-type peptidyl-prolyl cis-trans isomerase/Domain of unknown function (DUF4190)
MADTPQPPPWPDPAPTSGGQPWQGAAPGRSRVVRASDGGPGYGPRPSTARTNGLAIASLVLGILWLYWLGSLLAVVFGHIALRQIRRANGGQEGRGLAIAGAILGWVGLAVLAVVVALVVAVSDDLDDAGTTTDDVASFDDEFTGDGVPPQLPETTTPDYANPGIAEEVLGREPPTPEPPPADTAADALEVTTITEGEGEGAQAGDMVTVHYAGVLSDGTRFDDSWSRGEPFPVTLGQGMVIAGWDEGLIGVKNGERRHLVIGSDNAYGAEGSPPTIPVNAPLAFDVDVIDIQPGDG